MDAAFNEFMPFISKKSVTGMALHVLAEASGSKESLDLATRAWMTKLLESPHTRLAELQALTFGCMLAQEAGDIPAARAALKACSDLCIRLELNRHINARGYECDDQDLEAYYCFALCYLNDKGSEQDHIGAVTREVQLTAPSHHYLEIGGGDEPNLALEN
ncbi:hypothetical protein VTO58DRAFT_102913 [Aureobasidium pullulans]